MTIQFKYWLTLKSYFMSSYTDAYSNFDYNIATDACCVVPTPPGGSDCGCIDTWKQEYREKSSAYRSKLSEEKQKKEALAKAIEWRDALRKCFDSITVTHEKAQVVSSQMEVFADLLGRVCINTGKSVKVIESLLCMVMKLYGCIDNLKGKYDGLKRRIDCIKDPGLKQGEGILKCLDEYAKRLQEVVDTANGLLNSIVKALKAANLLDEYVCHEYGLKVNLQQLKGLFNGQNGAAAQAKTAVAFDPKPPSTFPCNSGKLDKPIQFPLNTDKFFTDTKAQLDEANGRLDGPGGLKSEYEKAAKEKNLLQACANSLEKAIKEWQEAKGCK